LQAGDQLVYVAAGQPLDRQRAIRALATLISERSLPFNPETLLKAAYRAGANGDPWDGYLKVKAATAENFAAARDPGAVLRHRLGLAP